MANFLDSLRKTLVAAGAGAAAAGRSKPASPRQADAPARRPALQQFSRPAASRGEPEQDRWAAQKLQAKNYADLKTGKTKLEPQEPKGAGQRGGIGAVALNEKAAKDVKDAEAEKRNKRESILDDGETEYKTKELSREEYLELTPRQRAAVDYNTLLTDAVGRDLANQDEYKAGGIEKDADYAERSKKLFGEERGSDLYAPETLALLSSLKLDDKVADLDDYLDLKTAITADDMDAIGAVAAPTINPGGLFATPDAERGRSAILNDLTSRTQQLTATMAKGNALLQSVSASLSADRDFRDDIGILGGSAPEVKTQTGFGGGDLDQMFQGYFDVLADKNSEKIETDFGFGTPDNILTQARKELGEENFAAFRQYADVRSRNSTDFSQVLGQTEGASYWKPDEFRKLLGLED